MGKHEWKLVAPWYRWERQRATDGRKPWETPPVFQKFDDTDFVKSFVRDPQHSLKFLDDEDRVFTPHLREAQPLKQGPLTPPNRFTELYAPRDENGNAATKAHEATLTPTGVRKLYLATHKRSYLVVCELHCYAPGFPTATRDQVCQAGFVVRRRRLNIPASVRKPAEQALRKILKETASIQSEIAYWQQTSPAAGLKAMFRKKAVQKASVDGSLAQKVEVLQGELKTKEQNLVQWRNQFTVTTKLEGWIPESVEHLGSWQPVEETPAQTRHEPFPSREATFPLFALFPDPKIPNHSAQGKNIYYGVVPTSALDTDRFGAPRFDSDTTYELRCFVRRHKTCCPRLDETPDCHGEVIWSEPTEIYRLAAATDLQGTSHRPITIKLPDLAELAAQARVMPPGKCAPVRMVQPQSMKFDVNDGKATGGGIGGFQICFFSIPLITIVAMFLLQLFLPIVVFLFGLFFLLKLKFCIPPSISASADLFAKLDLALPKLEADASLDVDVGLDAELGAGFSAGLNASLQKGIAEEAGISDPNEIAKLTVFSNAALLPLGREIHTAEAAADAEIAAGKGLGLELETSVELEPRVEVSVK